ncbi:MAG: hypothetical protein GF349_04770 [Candidatus Magasanikbacteria bacterium]|nr:hypothetical protein [Candidatus Magasanikbacteria bacterium]
MDIVNEKNIKRVVIDSISSLISATIDKFEVREFLINLVGFFKTKEITCLANYLMSENFGASRGQLLGNLSSNEMRLRSIVDGVILLRYVEREQSVRKLCNILKMRGSDHNKSIFEYEIKKEGFVLGDKFMI